MGHSKCNYKGEVLLINFKNLLNRQDIEVVTDFFKKKNLKYL